MIGKGFQGSEVVEAFEAGTIVILDEAIEELIAIGMGSEQPVGDAALGLAADCIDNSAIEAFDESIGLRAVGPGEAVLDAMACTKQIERMLAGGFVDRLVLLVDGETVGELGAIVGENSMHRMREVGQEALEEPFRSLRIPLWMDLQVDIACGAVDGDEGVAFAPLQRGQVLEIDMDEADGGLLENTDGRLVRLRALAQAVALQAAMDGAA
jgi:hypothetical protein